MSVRSHHPQAHGKLGDLHHRWTEASRLLAPAVKLLLQLLVLAFLFFIVGIPDVLLSSVPLLSGSFIAVFVADIFSYVFSAVGAYIMWAVIHGC